MRRALLFLCLLLAGCSHPGTAPSAPAAPPASPIETKAQINDEINKRYPPQQNPPTMTGMATVVFEILDSATNERVIWAVKDWASENNSMASSFTFAVGATPSPGIEAAKNSLKWIVAAADSKSTNMIGKSERVDYKTAKSNAFAEAAKADAFPTPTHPPF